MRKKLSLAIACCLEMLAPQALAECKELGTLEVEIEGLASAQGLVFVALDKRAEDFDQGPLSEARYRGKFIAAQGQKATLLFEDLPYGVYAVKTFHDANQNMQLDKNLLGIPTENYGFSNGARGTFGPPGFKDASFELRETRKAIKIQVK